MHLQWKTGWRFLKILQIIAIKSNSYIFWNIQRIQNKISMKYLHTHIHCSIIHNSQEMRQPKCSLIDKWINQLWYVFVCIHPRAKQAEVEWFYDNLQDLLELTPKKDILFIIRDWNVKVGSQEIPGITGKFGLRVQNEAGQKLTEFCQENGLIITKILFQQHKRQL